MTLSKHINTIRFTKEFIYALNSLPHERVNKRSWNKRLTKYKDNFDWIHTRIQKAIVSHELESRHTGFNTDFSSKRINLNVFPKLVVKCIINDPEAWNLLPQQIRDNYTEAVEYAYHNFQ